MLKELVIAAGISIAQASPQPIPPPGNTQLQAQAEREARAIHLFSLAAFAQDNCPGFDLDTQALVVALERNGYPLAWFKREDIKAREIRVLVMLGQKPVNEVCDSAWSLYGPSGFLKAGIFRDY